MNEEITIIDGEFAPVNQLPDILTANTNAIAIRSNVAIANSDVDNDFAFARTTLYDAITKGATALEELAEISRQSQHPRSYEVLATLLKNLSDVNDKLLNLHREKRDLDQDTQETSESTRPLVGNAVFVGSTAELLQLMKK
jgi:hypothetical protein